MTDCGNDTNGSPCEDSPCEIGVTCIDLTMNGTHWNESFWEQLLWEQFEIEVLNEKLLRKSKIPNQFFRIKMKHMGTNVCIHVILSLVMLMTHVLTSVIQMVQWISPTGRLLTKPTYTRNVLKVLKNRIKNNLSE